MITDAGGSLEFYSLSKRAFHLRQGHILIRMKQPVAETVPSPADIFGLIIHGKKIRVPDQFVDFHG